MPLIGCLESTYQDGQLRIPQESALSEQLHLQLNAWRNVMPVSDIYVLYLAIAIWSRVHGLVSLEIGDQFPSFVENIDIIYQLQLDCLIEENLIY
jgi:hypothetical protein